MHVGLQHAELGHHFPVLYVVLHWHQNTPMGSCNFCMLEISLIRMLQTVQGYWSCCLLICCMCRTNGDQVASKFCVACLQVLQEAQQVFGAAEQEPARDVAESMQYTVACLKV